MFWMGRTPCGHRKYMQHSAQTETLCINPLYLPFFFSSFISAFFSLSCFPAISLVLFLSTSNMPLTLTFSLTPPSPRFFRTSLHSLSFGIVCLHPLNILNAAYINPFHPPSAFSSSLHAPSLPFLPSNDLLSFPLFQIPP